MGLGRKVLMSSIFAVSMCGVAYSQDLKWCETEKDKIKGCVIIDQLEEGELSITIPYKNGKIHGDVVAEGYGDTSTIPYVNGKKEGNAKLLKDGKHTLAVRFKNDKAVEGKCANGKAIPSNQLRNAYNISSFDYEICK